MADLIGTFSLITSNFFIKDSFVFIGRYGYML